MVIAFIQKNKDLVFAQFNFAMQTLSYSRPKKRQEKNYRANAIKNSPNWRFISQSGNTDHMKQIKAAVNSLRNTVFACETV